MYYQYFGLREAPFSIAVNPRYLFMSHQHRDALAHLLYGVGVGGGFIVLTGEVGTGKTTINRALLEQMPDNADIAIVLNPALNAAELLATVCDELGISYERDDAKSLKALTDRLHRFLLENHSRGRQTVLLIDEAQHLDFDVLEQIRLLTNLETHSEKLLQIILIGQPELAVMLQRPELRQLNQRITARYNLEPLSRTETGAYIRHRLQIAGLGPGTELFPPGIVRQIHSHTRGIPRLINLLCDRMLLGAYGSNAPRVDRAMLRRALKEVTGETISRPRPPLVAALITGGLLLLLVVVSSSWFLLRNADPLEAKTTAQVKSPPAPNPLVAAAPPASSALSRARAEDDVSVIPEAVVERSWQLSPEAAFSGLWRLYRDTAIDKVDCTDDSSGELRCAVAVASTWEELLPLSRPLVLDLVTPSRFAAAALVLDMTDSEAMLATAAGVEWVPLARIAPHWQGRYRYFWAAPAAYDGVLGEGDRSAAVADIARRFATLDDQPEPLAGTRFNAALTARVKLFQKAEGLATDGLVGRETLRRLNLAVGQVPGPAARVERWTDLLAQGLLQ